jgi:hypothetical protein
VQGVTTTEYTPGMATYASAGICCIVGLWAGCCLIPFFVDQCKDVEVRQRVSSHCHFFILPRYYLLSLTRPSRCFLSSAQHHCPSCHQLVGKHYVL